MGGMSLVHWLIVGIIVLVLFGNRLPSAMRSLGRGVTEFKKGLEGRDEDEDEELEPPRKKKPARQIEEDSDEEEPERPRKKKASAEADDGADAQPQKPKEEKQGAER